MQYFSVNQTEFAAMLGISRSLLGKIMNGERTLTYEVSQKLSAVQKEMAKTAETSVRKKSLTSHIPEVPAYYVKEQLMKAEIKLKEATVRLDKLESDYSDLLECIRRNEEGPQLKGRSEYAEALRDYHRKMKVLDLRKRQKQMERKQVLPARATVAGLRAVVEFWRAL